MSTRNVIFGVMWNSVVNFKTCRLFYKGIANESKKLYGVQFHPEVGLTENGKVMLKNFLYDVAGCSGTFTVQNREIECIREIKEKVGSSKVLVSILLLRYRSRVIFSHGGQLLL